MYISVDYLTIEEYLQAEEKSQIRHEYLSGRVFAMSGGSKEHNIITLNIASRLRSHLRGSSCSVFMSDMKVKIKLASQDKSIFYYPDVTVTCAPQDDDRFFLNYPCLIIEVLSPSTEAIDRREKLLNYQMLESLQEYVLISQDEMKVEIYRKGDRGNWLVRVFNNSDKEVRLESINRNLTLTEIYEDVFTL